MLVPVTPPTPYIWQCTIQQLDDIPITYEWNFLGCMTFMHCSLIKSIESLLLLNFRSEKGYIVHFRNLRSFSKNVHCLAYFSSIVSAI